jgi:hypothetical protein
MGFAVQRLHDWSSLNSLARESWIYRGQMKSEWTLSSSIERCLLRQGIVMENRGLVEADLIREFRRMYHRYATHTPSATSLLEWLSIMQHHGAPTRLLDFSYSIYVAAYFAIEHSDSDAAIWAVNGMWTLEESIKRMASAGKKGAEKLKDRFTSKHEEVIRPLFFEAPYVKVACAGNPFRLSDRIQTQKGVFLIQGDIEESFVDNIKALSGWDDSVNMMQIVIPKELHKEGIRKLYEMNITRTSLFPGLDGFSRSLDVYHPAFEPSSWRGDSPAKPKDLLE